MSASDSRCSTRLSKKRYPTHEQEHVHEQKHVGYNLQNTNVNEGRWGKENADYFNGKHF